jgi:hypothetical protein
MRRGRLAVMTLAAFLGSLPIFAVPVLLLLDFLHATGNSAHATLLVGVYSLANAVGLPVQGRLMVRVDHRLVLGVAAAVHAVALVALAHAHGWLLVAACVVAGLAFPEINASLRTLLVQREDGPRGRRRLSISVASFEVAAVTGPLLGAWASAAVSGAAALTVSATWTAAITGLYGTAIAAGRGEPRLAQPGRAPAPAGRRVYDWALIVFAVAPAACYSLLAAAAGLAAAAHGATVLVGAVRAALSAGALLGAVWLSWRPGRSPRRALVGGFIVLAAVSLLAVPATNSCLTVALFVLGGCAFAPISVSMTLLVDRAKAAAVIGVIHAATVLSGGLFTALTGPLYDAGGTRVPYLLSVVVAVVGGLVAASRVTDPAPSPRDTTAPAVPVA